MSRRNGPAGYCCSTAWAGGDCAHNGGGGDYPPILATAHDVAGDLLGDLETAQEAWDERGRFPDEEDDRWFQRRTQYRRAFAAHCGANGINPNTVRAPVLF